MGVFGIGDMLGIGDIDGIEGICPIGIFMSFMPQQSQLFECAKKSRYTPAAMMKMPTAIPVMARAG